MFRDIRDRHFGKVKVALQFLLWAYFINSLNIAWGLKLLFFPADRARAYQEKDFMK